MQQQPEGLRGANAYLDPLLTECCKEAITVAMPCWRAGGRHREGMVWLPQGLPKVYNRLTIFALMFLDFQVFFIVRAASPPGQASTIALQVAVINCWVSIVP